MNILIVDDQRGARAALAAIVRQLPGAQVREAENLAQARTLLEKRDIDVALIDLRLDQEPGNRDGLTLVGEVRQQSQAVPIVVTVAHEMAEIRTAMRLGAYDYILKDELCEELVLPILEGLRNRRDLEREVLSLRSRGSSEALQAIIGTSDVIQRLREVIQRVAMSDRPVLVRGPTGSGKELVVRALHALGPRPEAPLLDLNCGAVPAQLMEALLFGHERGAFTGADRRQNGLLSAVQGGTLFLDEIAELPLDLQTKLLRVLEVGTFRVVGASATSEFKGRVVAATHADLEQRVASNSFREDLYYRLNVLDISVPSLEERREDIPNLVAHFASRQVRPLQFTPEALQILKGWSWPGNVRLLRNIVDRLAVFAPSPEVTPAVLEGLRGNELATSQNPNPDQELARAVLRMEGEDKLQLMEQLLVDEALRVAGGNKSAAARLLGVHRKIIERRLLRSGNTGVELDA